MLYVHINFKLYSAIVTEHFYLQVFHNFPNFRRGTTGVNTR
jgi:hypothetical protein